MKKLFVLLAVTAILFCFVGCNSASENYYEDTREKFITIDEFARDQFDYTVRVKENGQYMPVANTADLIVDYNTYTSNLESAGGWLDYYFNYLANRSYTYTFMNAEQCETVFNAYYDMLVDATYTQLDLVGTNYNGEEIEFYMQSYDMSKPGDIVILNNEVGSKTITIGFAPEYNPDRFEIDDVTDNTDFSIITVACGVALVVAAILFVVLAVIKHRKKK